MKIALVRAKNSSYHVQSSWMADGGWHMAVAYGGGSVGGVAKVEFNDQATRY